MGPGHKKKEYALIKVVVVSQCHYNPLLLSSVATVTLTDHFILRSFGLISFHLTAGAPQCSPRRLSY